MSFDDAAGKWDQRYTSADGFLFGREPNAWLAANTDQLPAHADVLCVADGEGRNSISLAAQGHRVTAFDISSVAMARLNAFATERGVDVQASVSSVNDWPWQEVQYDAVVAIFIQFADPELRAWLFGQMARAVRPGGLLILEGYGLRQVEYKTGGPGIAENLYTLPLLREAFDGWHFLSVRDEDRTISEGTGHSGLSHLVSVLIRKPEHG